MRPVQLWLIYFYIGSTGVLADGIHYLEPQQTLIAPPIEHVQLRASSLFGGGRWDNCGTLIIAAFYLKIWFLSMNGTKNPQHRDCGRSIPATHDG